MGILVDDKVEVIRALAKAKQEGYELGIIAGALLIIFGYLIINVISRAFG